MNPFGMSVSVDVTQLPEFPGTSLANSLWAVIDPTTGIAYKLRGDQIVASGQSTALYITASAGVTNVASLIGKSVYAVLRGGIGAGEVIITGVPNSDQVLWDTISGDLDAGNPWLAGEKLTIFYS